MNRGINSNAHEFIVNFGGMNAANYASDIQSWGGIVIWSGSKGGHLIQGSYLDGGYMDYFTVNTDSNGAESYTPSSTLNYVPSCHDGIGSTQYYPNTGWDNSTFDSNVIVGCYDDCLNFCCCSCVNTVATNNFIDGKGYSRSMVNVIEVYTGPLHVGLAGKSNTFINWNNGNTCFKDGSYSSVYNSNTGSTVACPDPATGPKYMEYNTIWNNKDHWVVMDTNDPSAANYFNYNNVYTVDGTCKTAALVTNTGNNIYKYTALAQPPTPAWPPTPPAAPGTLALTYSPSAAAVVLSNGQTVTPGNTSLPPGSYSWAAVATGYVSQAGSFTIVSGQPYTLNIDLQATPPPPTNVFGLNSGDSIYAEPANTLNAQRFQNTAGAGVITKLELFFNTSSPLGNVRLGVYADNNGVPGALLLDAGSVAVSNGWVGISGLNLPVTALTYYWLAYVEQSPNGTEYSSTAGNAHYWRNSVTYGALPTSFGTASGHNTTPYVIRATVSPSGPVVAPIASFAIGLTVQFTDSTKNTPTSWSWNFGDGATSTTQNPIHTYNLPGTYTITLTATNSGGSSTASHVITMQ